jgi:hypothetical protein
MLREAKVGIGGNVLKMALIAAMFQVVHSAHLTGKLE